MRVSARLGAPIALLICAALAAVGCGDTVVDNNKLAETLAAELRSSGTKVSSVDCPSDVEVQKGAKFTCAVELTGGGAETATLEILNENADVRLVDLSPSERSQSPEAQ